MTTSTETVSFTRMDEGTTADYELLARKFEPYMAESPDRYIAALEAQRHERSSGYPIDRCEHALQSATRARRDGADPDWIVAALLHDIGDALAPMNHDRMAAEIIRPFVREEVTWVVAHHGIFQQHHAGPMNGTDPDARERFRGHPYFEAAAAFCARWDQISFDPSYESDSMESFRPELTEVFARPAFDPLYVRPDEVLGLPSASGRTLDDDTRNGRY